MNKIFNVNLGGYPFTIDEDAYHAINKYLGAIQAHFADSEGCDEILDDIEARIAELFTQYLDGSSIVTMKEYNAVVKIMGRPEDFGANAMEDEYSYQDEPTASTGKGKGKYGHIKTGKRLFRDEEDKVIGGVCAGIGAYFGVSDPLWIRLGFVALVFLGGITVLVYPLLWAIVPKAKTAGDKLKMRGEPATVSNIAKTVEEELTELSNKITEISKDLGSKKKVKSTSLFSPKSAVSGLLAMIGKGILGVLGVIKAIVKPIFSLSLGLILLFLGILWGTWIISFLTSFSFLSYLGPSSWILSFFGRISLFFTVGIPIVGLMLWITKWFSSYRIPAKWRTNMRLGWVASFATTLAAGVMTGLSYSHSAEVDQRASYSMNSDVINITELKQPENKSVGFLRLPGLSYTKGGIVFDEVHYDIVKGTEDEVVVSTKITSQGQSYEDAQSLAEKVNARHEVTGDNIMLPKSFKSIRGNKFRAQSIQYTIHIPEGKTVNFDESISWRLWGQSDFKGMNRPSSFEDYSWTMTSEGLVSDDWENKYRATRKIEIENLANLNIDGDMETTITYGEKIEVLLKGNKSDIDKVEEIITADATSLKLDKRARNDIKLEIVTPNLATLHAKNLSSLKIEGFKQDKMEINYGGKNHRHAELNAYMDIKDLTCNIGGYNNINLIGSGDNLTMNILDGSKVNAEQYKAKNVIVKGRLNGTSTFYASENFDCPKEQKYHIKLYGNPGLLVDNIEKK